MEPRVVLLMCDVDRAGVIEHAVLYDQDRGKLNAILGSYDAGPFDTAFDFGGWLWRSLRPTVGAYRRLP